MRCHSRVCYGCGSPDSVRQLDVLLWSTILLPSALSSELWKATFRKQLNGEVRTDWSVCPNLVQEYFGRQMCEGFSTYTDCIFLFFIAIIKHSRLGNVRNEVYPAHFWRLKVQGKVELGQQEKPDFLFLSLTPPKITQENYICIFCRQKPHWPNYYRSSPTCYVVNVPSSLSTRALYTKLTS